MSQGRNAGMASASDAPDHRGPGWPVNGALDTPPEVEAVANSIEWLAIAQMLVLFHGRERAWTRLQALGCPFTQEAS